MAQDPVDVANPAAAPLFGPGQGLAKGNEEPIAPNEGSDDELLTQDGVSVLSSGMCGTCPWSIDSNHLLTIGPGTLGQMSADTWPWLQDPK